MVTWRRNDDGVAVVRQHCEDGGGVVAGMVVQMRYHRYSVPPSRRRLPAAQLLIHPTRFMHRSTGSQCGHQLIVSGFGVDGDEVAPLLL